MKKRLTSVAFLFLSILFFAACQKNKLNIFTDLQPGMNWDETKAVLAANKITPGEYYGHQTDWDEDVNIKVVAASLSSRYALCDILSFRTKINGRSYDCAFYFFDGILFDMELSRNSGNAGLTGDGPAYQDRLNLEKFILSCFPEKTFETVEKKSHAKYDVLNVDDSKKIEISIEREWVWCNFIDVKQQEEYENFSVWVKQMLNEMTEEK